MDFSFEELSEKLKKLKMSQKEFADYLGVSNTTISKWKAKNKASKYAFLVMDYIEDIYTKNQKLKFYITKGNK